MASAEDSPSGRATHDSAADVDPLIRLEQRLERAEQAAERLIAEATAAAMRKPPPSGWQRREPDSAEPAGSQNEAGSRASGPGRDATGEIELLLEAVRALRDRIPPDLQRRLAEALREVLVALRALIDWYLERSQRERRETAEVRDIPIL